MEKVTYLTKRMILAIHQMSLEIFQQDINEVGMRPDQSLGFVERIVENEIFGEKIYQDCYEQAAAYMFYVIKNHCFIDGNKRTGLAIAVTFLELNGYYFPHLQEEDSYNFVMSVAGGPNNPEIMIPEIAQWLKKISIPTPA